MDKSQMNVHAKLKRHIQKAAYYDTYSIYMTFLQRQNQKNRKQISGYWDNQEALTIKGHGEYFGNYVIS